MQKISVSNPIIKSVRKLKKKSYDDLIVVEGLGVLAMALNADIDVKAFLYCDEMIYSDEAIRVKEEYEKISKNVYAVSEKIYMSLADKENSGGFIAVIRYKTIDVHEVDYKDKDFILVLNGLELPGNMGSIYRTSYACNVDLVMIVDCETDISNPKFVTSSRGVFFDVPTTICSYETAVKVLLEKGYRIILAEPEMGKAYNHFNYDGKIAIVVGSERFGINKDWYSHPNDKIFIPMRENIKSLNVGVAASILLYEAATEKGKV